MEICYKLVKGKVFIIQNPHPKPITLLGTCTAGTPIFDKSDRIFVSFSRWLSWAIPQECRRSTRICLRGGKVIPRHPRTSGSVWLESPKYLQIPEVFGCVGEWFKRNSLPYRVEATNIIPSHLRHFWVDDFPAFPMVGYVIVRFLEGKVSVFGTFWVCSFLVFFPSQHKFQVQNKAGKDFQRCQIPVSIMCF